MYTYSVYKNNKLKEIATNIRNPKTHYIAIIIAKAKELNQVEQVVETDKLDKLEYTMFYYKNYSIMRFKEN